MKKGFSLIELLVVVTIISVLTGAALPFVNEYVEQSRRAKAGADLEAFTRAINAFETVEAKDFSDTSGQVLIGRFIQKMPVDPWGSAYSFASCTEVNGATVACAGPDRILGSSDDIAQSYKGRLAIVSARWVDANADGKVSQGSGSIVLATDSLIVRFNRAASSTPLRNTANIGISLNTGTISSGNWAALVASGSTTLSAAFSQMTADSKQITYKIGMLSASGDANGATSSLKIGSSTIKILRPARVVDLGGNPSVSAPVTVTAN